MFTFAKTTTQPKPLSTFKEQFRESEDIRDNPTFPAPIAGIFYADPTDPMPGGTGHTIRVCQDHIVPVILQNDLLT